MWIPSKLTTPAPLHKSIQRARLLDKLQEADHYKLVLFQSPAGFGKTTMAAQWLSHCKHLGWFSLDGSDNDPFSFANYFIRALNKATNDACHKTTQMVLRRQFANLMTLFTQVISELEHWQDKAYLVLDDYHLIEEKEIHEAVSYFIKHMPANVTLVITSRTQPPLRIANLRVRCQLLEVDNQALAFDKDETHRFFSLFNHHALADEHTNHALCTQVEGWPSALQLIALNSLQSCAKLSIEGTNTLTHLWDYLAEEVFEQLDEQSRIFLMQCSVFERFNYQLINLVTGQDNSLTLLNNFNRQGLFINTLDGNEQWYRFHNLFADFLTYQRLRLMPALEDELYERAVNAWLMMNHPAQALRCALLTKNTSLRLKVLLEHGRYLFNHGNIHLLDEALKTLAPDVLYRHPCLILIKAWLAQVQNKSLDIGQLLEQGMQEMAVRKVSLTCAEQGEFDALLAQVAINQHLPERALELSERAFEQLPSHCYHSRIVATSVVAEVHHCRGQLNRALPLMQQTEKLARQHEVYHQALWALLQQCEIETARGATLTGIELLNKAEELVKNYHLEQLSLHDFMLYLRAQLAWSLNQLDEAKSFAHRSLEAAANYDAAHAIPAYSILSKIYLTKGELDKAERQLEHCERALNLMDCHLDWRANVYMTQLILWQQREDSTNAALWLEKAEVPETATNHFSQLQHRNIARAHFICKNYDKAFDLLTSLYQISAELELVADMQRNLTLLAAVQEKRGMKKEAELCLISAIDFSTRTRVTVGFHLDRAALFPILSRISKKNEIDQIIKHQIRALLDTMNRNNHSRAIHFDEGLVKKLLASDVLPNAVRSSPLTLREWQVLGLIYSGFSNDQIAIELDVAPTTIKTHIRNLYQKLQIANREQAIAIADRLIKTLSY